VFAPDLEGSGAMSQAAGNTEGPDPAGRRTTRASAASGQRPYGKEEVRRALLDAAQQLIAERGPSNVTLREIADAAGVNFGLVYQYVGTREELLREVYQTAARRSAVQLERLDGLPDAIGVLMSAPGTSIGRIMAWAVLEGEYPADVLGPSPALEHIARVIAGHAAGGQPADPGDDDRLLAAFLLVAAMAWRLFSPIGLTSAGLDPAPDPVRDEKVTEWLRQLAARIAAP
jgi:TetR/AcrR family transcriptional regulator, repressor for neighboring sulfatase